MPQNATQNARRTINVGYNPPDFVSSGNNVFKFLFKTGLNFVHILTDSIRHKSSSNVFDDDEDDDTS
jgi:hypothetical protein